MQAHGAQKRRCCQCGHVISIMVGGGIGGSVVERGDHSKHLMVRLRLDQVPTT